MNVLEKTGKNATFFCVPTEKEVTKFDKNGGKSFVTISYKFKDCDCFLEYECVGYSLIKHKFLSFNKYY